MTSVDSLLTSHSYWSQAVKSEVEYKVLTPSAASDGQSLPLILHLHGAMSSAASLESARSAYERAWLTGEFPPSVVVCASTPTIGGFYIDYPNGKRWESLVGDELPQHLRGSFPLSGEQAIIGFSMGGYAALKIALRNPLRYLAVAALCPAIFPGETADLIPSGNLPFPLDELNAAMGSDVESYRLNSVYGIIRKNYNNIIKYSPGVFFDCGQDDEFSLHDGAYYLHRLLSDLSIAHEFRSVPGANHADKHVDTRRDHAVKFLGKAFTERRKP